MKLDPQVWFLGTFCRCGDGVLGRAPRRAPRRTVFVRVGSYLDPPGVNAGGHIIAVVSNQLVRWEKMLFLRALLIGGEDSPSVGKMVGTGSRAGVRIISK